MPSIGDKENITSLRKVEGAHFPGVHAGEMSQRSVHEVRSIWDRMFHHVKEFNVAIVPADLETRMSFPREAGSGVGVRIAGRFFIATAAHVLRGPPPRRELRPYQANFIPSSDPSNRSPLILRGGLRGGKDRDPQDLGWLELDPRTTSKMGISFLELPKLRPYCNGDRENVVVFGSPVCDLQDDKIHQGEPFVLKASPWGTRGLVDRRDINGDPDPDTIYLDWTKRVEDGLEGSFERPEPHGISGGGIWSLSDRTEGWSAMNIQLIGIETALRRRPDQHLVGFQIQAWLRMLQEDLPELTPQIAPVLAARPIGQL